MKEVQGLVFDIKRFAVHDGPGIRTTVFLKGCPANCWWCHNPESQSGGLETVRRSYKIGERSFEETETVGRRMTVSEVWQEIRKDTAFADASGGGVTISGGEPLMQPDFLSALLRKFGTGGVHRVLDTTGFAPPDVFDRIIPDVDLFLFDLKLMDDGLHQIYTGISNKPILRNLQTLIGHGSRIILRFPVIPGHTDTPENIQAICRFVSGLKDGVEEIDLLPFHDIARAKYHRYRDPEKYLSIRKPEPGRLNEIRDIFQNQGFSVKIGG